MRGRRGMRGTRGALRPLARLRLPVAGARAAALVLGLALLQGACASRTAASPRAPQGGDAAAVRVVNRTSSDVTIEADDRPLGGVAAGAEQLFVGLQPGTVDLRGRSLDGGLSFRRDLLTLEAGETFTWVLREGGGGAPPAEPMAGSDGPASILVQNATPWSVQIVLDGSVLGDLSTGRTGRFGGITAGSHRLEARARESSFPLEFPVLEPGETFTWKLRAPDAPEIVGAGGILPAPGTGRLRVENPHEETLTILVNGTPLGTVRPRDTRIFDELSATRVLLSARSADGATLFRGPSGPIEPGRVLTWRVGAGEAAPPGAGVAAVEPPRGEALPVEEEGFPRREPVPEEPVYEEEPIYVDSDEDRPLDDEDRPLDEELLDEEPRDRGFEEAAPGAGEVTGKAFVVENRTTQDLEILLDGQSVGAVGAGMTARFTSLPAVRFTPSARNASGSREFDHPPVDLSGQASFTWIIEP